jgi:predicted ATP-grasp superfamily ATP-dependent carboligase
VLVRHRNESDNFAVSVSNGGKQVNVYINETKYTMQNGQLEVNGITTQLPYKIKHEIQIREVTIGTNKFMRLSAWVGLDIYYNGFGVHLSINGFYRRQTAGLCGNANDDSSRDDEMVTPACEVAKTTEDFI